MLNFSPAKVGFILIITLFGLLAAVPNFLDEKTREGMPGFLPSNTLSLGLDLRGGVHLLLGADVEDIIATRLDGIVDRLRVIRRSVDGLNFADIKVGAESVSFTVTRAEMVETARQEMNEFLRPVADPTSPLGTVQEVLLSTEGQRFTLSLTAEGLAAAKRDAIERSMSVVRKRIDPEGTREVTIQPQGESRIILQVPGADDPTELVRLINTTAKLTFHDVDDNASPESIRRGRVGPGKEIVQSREGAPVVIFTRPIVDGGDLIKAKAAFDERNQPAVAFEFNQNGSRRFANHTRDNVGRPFAIRLDDEIISAPVIQSAILGGSGIINNIGSVERANELATLLSAGALPVRLQVEEQRTVGPSLGSDSIAAGQLAALIGFVGVIVYMAVSYGLFGLIANMSLIINLFLIVGLLSLVQATLTLPGIAGIVLTIGMAVDANVLIFERIREEQRSGKKPFQAIEQGYAQAFSTILDANITTFIAAAILYLLGSGPVQGFAVTLTFGIMTSMFTAILFSRWVISMWVQRAKPQSLAI